MQGSPDFVSSLLGLFIASSACLRPVASGGTLAQQGLVGALGYDSGVWQQHGAQIFAFADLWNELGSMGEHGLFSRSVKVVVVDMNTITPYTGPPKCTRHEYMLCGTIAVTIAECVMTTALRDRSLLQKRQQS